MIHDLEADETGTIYIRWGGIQDLGEGIQGNQGEETAMVSSEICNAVISSSVFRNLPKSLQERLRNSKIMRSVKRKGDPEQGNMSLDNSPNSAILAKPLDKYRKRNAIGKYDDARNNRNHHQSLKRYGFDK